MSKIKFNSQEHEAFYQEMLSRVRIVQVYHKAFFYCMGACDVTRDNIDALFDFQTGGIRPDNLHQGFQTGTSYKVTRMAFNLWNGYVEEGEEKLMSPSELFACTYGDEFHQAIQLRYPEYNLEQEVDIVSVVEKLARKRQATSGQVDQKKQLADSKDGER